MPDRLLRRVNGLRGSALLCIAGLGVVHTGAYIDVGRHTVLPSGLDQLDAVIPLAVYAALWGLGSAMALAGALTDRQLRQRDRWDAWGFSLVPGLLAVWGITYLLGWMDARDGRQWVFGVIYLLVSGLALTAARMTNPGSATRRPSAWTRPTSSQR